VRHRIGDQGPVPEDEDLIGGQDRVEVFQLLPVLAQADVLPEIRPAGISPLRFPRARLQEVAARVQAR